MQRRFAAFRTEIFGRQVACAAPRWFAVGVGQADRGELGGEWSPGGRGLSEGGRQRVVVPAHPAIEGGAAGSAMGAQGREHLNEAAVLARRAGSWRQQSPRRIACRPRGDGGSPSSAESSVQRRRGRVTEVLGGFLQSKATLVCRSVTRRAIGVVVAWASDVAAPTASHA
jgi:hypothetical protein